GAASSILNALDAAGGGGRARDQVDHDGTAGAEAGVIQRVVATTAVKDAADALTIRDLELIVPGAAVNGHGGAGCCTLDPVAACEERAGAAAVQFQALDGREGDGPGARPLNARGGERVDRAPDVGLIVDRQPVAADAAVDADVAAQGVQVASRRADG